jgi:hypothetical protein
MVYREPDSQRVKETAEEDESREALERLAAAGLRKQAQLVERKQADATEAMTRTTTAQFRRRAWRGGRKLRFVGFWFATCTVLSLGYAIFDLLLHRDLADAIASAIVGFVLINGVSLLVVLPLMIVWAIHCALWRRRDARELLAWQAILPFRLDGMVETLSLDHTLSALRIVLRYTGDTPREELVRGLVGHLPDAAELTIVAGNKGQALFRSSLSDGDGPNEPTVFIRTVVERIALPLHAVHAIAHLSISEADSSETSTWQDAHKRLSDSLGGSS